MVAAAAALMGASSAGATVTVSVDGSNVVHVAGDGGASSINFTDGAHTSDGTDYGAEVFSQTDTISAGSGCFTGPDVRNGQQLTAAFCGSSTGASVVIDGGDGNDTIKYDTNEYGDPYEKLLSAITAGGGAGDDTLDFSGFNVVTFTPTITGGDGNDKVTASAGSLNVDLGAGDDEFDGNAGTDVVHGGDGNDTINGGPGNDQLFGDAGNDTIDGGEGNDQITGGAGQDSLSGDGDTAFPGNDEIFAADGERDSVSCGFGGDIAHVDQYDAVEGAGMCESVDKQNVGGTSGGTTTQSGPQVGAAKISVTVPRRLKRRALARNGAQITITSDQQIAGGVEIAVDAKTAKRLHIGHKTVVLGRHIGAVSGSSVFTVKPKAKYRSAIAKARKFTLYVVLAVQDQAGNQGTKQYRVTISP